MCASLYLEHSDGFGDFVAETRLVPQRELGPHGRRQGVLIRVRVCACMCVCLNVFECVGVCVCVCVCV